MLRSSFTGLPLLLLGAGCISEPNLSAGPDGRLGSLAGTEWRLESIDGRAPPAEAWIGFETESRAGGNAGCNSFGAAYRFDGGPLSIEPMEMTEMACDQPRMALEAAFVSALRGTRRAGTSADRLVMISADGDVLAAFTRRD